jgi:hypothetical protein
MAVSLVSSPSVSPTWTAVDDGFVLVVNSTTFGTAGVTQHRFRAQVASVFGIAGDRYTIVTNTATKNGSFDLADMFKTVLLLSPNSYSLGIPLTQMIIVDQQADEEVVTFAVQLYEEYYLSGVFTQVTGPLIFFEVLRGFTDQANQVFKYANWWQRNGLSKFMPYTGQMPQVYPQRTEDPAWGVGAWVNINIDATPGGNVFNSWFLRTSAGKQGKVYFPIYYAGVTDQENFQKLTVTIRTNSVPSGGTIRETYDIERTQFECVDDQQLIMFKDSNHSWAFMSFTKKSRTTVNVDRLQTADKRGSGRYRYNVEASDTITLNTDWMFDAQNVLVREMMVSDQFYLVDSTGALTQVVIVPNSLRLQTSRNDGLFQYQVSFRKSADIFVP